MRSLLSDCVNRAISASASFLHSALDAIRCLHITPIAIAIADTIVQAAPLSHVIAVNKCSIHLAFPIYAALIKKLAEYATCLVSSFDIEKDCKKQFE